jgi:type IV secretion system protein VirD4
MARICHYHGDGHIYVVAATGTGKTAAIVYPTLLAGQPGERHRSMILNDPKGALYWAYNDARREWRGTAGYRATLGKVVLLAPFHTDTDFYNPWDSIRVGTDDEYGDAEILAHYLTNPEDKENLDETSRHFQSLANQVVAGIFLYGLHERMATTGSEFDALVTQTPWDDLLTVMEAHPHPLVRRAAGVARMPGDRELGSLKTTLANALRIFADPRIARFTARSTFALTDLREQEQPCTVYVTIPFGQGKRLRPLARLLYAQMLTYCTAHVGGWRHNVLALLEEFPSLGRFEFASDLLNYAREAGMQLCLITPSMEELIDTYGSHNNFLEGCRVQVVFGLTDAGVAKKFAGRVGTVTHTVKRVTQQARGGRSITTDTKEQDLLSPTALLQLGEREVLVLVGRYKRILEQSRYYEHAVWDARSRMAPPERRPSWKILRRKS